MSMSANELLRLAKDARLRLETLKLPEGAVRICVAGLARMEKVLAQPPRVAIMGEVNSGKTSVADLLLGAGVLPSSVVVNTHVPVLIRYADELTLDAVTQQGRRRLSDDSLDELPSGLQLKRIEIGMPSERLSTFEILDTPGGYAPGGGQPDAQIFIWCTVATRAWTESERAHWTQLPRRCRHNGLLVATHKDALAHTGDVEKVEQRLRTATATMFRDMAFVTATGAPRYGMLPYLDELSPDERSDLLLERIGAWAAEISVRRARKAERIIRHLARLTFHRLMPGPLSFDAASILKEWESDCAKLLAGIDASPTNAARVIQALLVRFAQSLSEARTGRVAARAPMALPERNAYVCGSFRTAAMRRYVRLIGADLTALLRIDLAQWGMREPAQYLDYAAARSVLLPLANLDATFDELGQRFAEPSTAAPEPAKAGIALTATRHA
jgi:hypothetical protein